MLLRAITLYAAAHIAALSAARARHMSAALMPDATCCFNALLSDAMLCCRDAIFLRKRCGMFFFFFFCFAKRACSKLEAQP